MAGFAAGFGSSFADSFRQSRAISAQKEQDKFKLWFSDYTTRRDEDDKTEKEANAQIKAAKEAVARTGAPVEMWGPAAKMLRDGYKIDDVDTWLTENQFVVEPTSVTNDDPNVAPPPQSSLPEQANGSVEAQMAESGMAPPADKGIFGNLKDKLGLGPQQADINGVTAQPQHSRRDQRRMQEIADMQGVPVEEVQQTLSRTRPEPVGLPDVSYKAIKKGTPLEMSKVSSLREAATGLTMAQQSGDPTQIKLWEDVYNAQVTVEAVIAQAELGSTPTLAAREGSDGKVDYLRYDPATQVWRDPKTGQEGTPTRIFDQNDMKLLDEIEKSTSEERKKYREKTSNFTTMSREAKGMADIVKSDIAVLGASGYVAKFTSGVIRDAQNTISLFTNAKPDTFIQSSEIRSVDRDEANLTATLQEMTGRQLSKEDRIFQLATKRSLLEIKAVKWAYAQAAANGQTGTGVSAVEFKRHYDKAMEADPQAWMRAVQDSVSNEYKNIESLGNQINQFAEGKDRFEMMNGVPAPVGQAVSIEELLSVEDDETQAFIKQMREGKAPSSATNPNQMNPEPVELPPGVTPTNEVTPDGRKIYMKDGVKVIAK